MQNKFQRFDIYYDGMDASPDGAWVKYDDMYAALQAYETQLAESKVSLESANAEIAKLKIEVGRPYDKVDRLFESNKQLLSENAQLAARVAELEATEKIYHMNREWIDSVKARVTAAGFVTDYDLKDLNTKPSEG